MDKLKKKGMRIFNKKNKNEKLTNKLENIGILPEKMFLPKVMAQVSAFCQVLN